MMAFLRWCWAMSLKLFMLVMPVELCLFALLPTDLDPFLKLEGSFCNIHRNSYNSSFWRSVSRVFFFLVCLCFALLFFFTLLFWCVLFKCSICDSRRQDAEGWGDARILGVEKRQPSLLQRLGPTSWMDHSMNFPSFFYWCGDTRSCQVSNWASSGCALIPP